MAAAVKTTPNSPPPPEGLAAAATPPQDAAWKLLLAPQFGKKFSNIKMAARQRQNEIDTRSAKMFAVHQKVSEAIRSRKTYAEIRSLISASNVVVSLPNERQIKIKQATEGQAAVDKALNVSYRHQGNLDMYSSENMKIREKNRHHPEVKAAIDHFWSILPKTNFGNVNRAIYTWYSRNLFFHFVDNATEEEFQKVVVEDWKNDAVWSCSMNERMFGYAIYNLADIWCETLQASEYCDFINSCAEVIAAAPPYRGSRVEGDVTDSRERVSDGRRLSVAVEGRRRLSGFEALEDDEEAPVEETIDAIQRDLVLEENLAWYTTIQTLQDIAAGESTDCEDDLSRLFEEVQQRRYDLFKEDTDPTFPLLSKFSRELEVEIKQRDNIVADIKERQQLLKKEPARILDIPQRVEKRQKQMLQHAKEQKALLNDIREATLQAFLRIRTYKNSLLDLNRGAFKEALTRVSTTQNDLRILLQMQLSDMGRRAEAESERNDDYFSLFVATTKELEDFRRLVAKRRLEPIEAELYKVDGQKDHDIIKFDSPKWVATCEWFEKFRSMCNENIDQVVIELDELITRQQFRGKQQLFAIHRQQIDFESKLIDALAETNLLPNDIKIARLNEAKKAKEEATERRAKEADAFQKLIEERKAAIGNLQTSHGKRQALEGKELKAWLKSTKVSDAFEVSKEVLDCMVDDVAELEMEETTATGPRVIADLPVNVIEPMQMLRFVVLQHDSWYLALLELVARLRTQTIEQSHQFLFRIECAEEQRQIEHNQMLLNMRLDDIHRIKAELSEEETRAMLTVSCQSRLAHSGDVRDALSEVDEQMQAARAAVERYALLLEQRHYQRRVTYAKIFSQQRYQFMKIAEIEQLLTQTLESRYVNQSAAARKAALLQQNLGERRQREEERLRLARERVQAEAKEAEARRLQAIADTENEKRRLEEIKSMKQKDQLELRKRQMKEREARLQERLKREKDEQQAWREAFLRELNDRKTPGKSGTPQPPAVSRRSVSPQVAAVVPTPSVLRRKGPKGKSGGTQKEETPSRVANRIQATIDAEISIFRVLNTQSLAVDLNDFNVRRMEYLVDGASNRSIYQSECQRLKIDPRASVEVLLSEEPLDFQLSSLPLSHFTELAIRPLLDVIALNPVQRIQLRGVGLDKDDVKKLAQHLQRHPFIHVLDVSGNKDVGAHGGQSLLSLVKENRCISSVTADDCGVPDDVLKEIVTFCKKNEFARGFSRTDFDCIATIFAAIDTDGNGTVDGSELADYLKSHASPQRSTEASSPTKASETASIRQDDVKRALMELNTRGFETKGGLSFPDLLVALYPHLSLQEASDLVQRYGDDSSSSLDFAEVEEFMATFGVDHALTLEQLAQGLDEDVELVRAAFQEADIDNDGLLNMNEFIAFVNR